MHPLLTHAQKKTLLTVSLLLTLFAYISLYYGVGFSDEAYYVAMPFRFVIGDQPFIDEWFMSQSAGILVAPLYKVFFDIQKNTDGIFLYGRHLYFIFSVLITFIVYKGVKNITSSWIALSGSVLYLAYIPFGIPYLSYNTLGIGFFVGSLFLAFDVMQRKLNTRYLFLIGSLSGLSAFAYPPLLFIYLILALIYMTSFKEKYFKCLLTYFTPWFILGVCVLTLFKFSLRNIEYFLNINKLYSTFYAYDYGFGKVLILFSELWQYHAYLLPVPFLALLFKKYIGAKYRILFISVVLAAVFLKTRATHNEGGSSVYLISLFICYPFFLWIKGIGSSEKKLIYAIYIPSFLVCLMMSWISRTGFMTGAIALVPVLMLYWCLFWENPSPKQLYLSPLSPSLIIICALFSYLSSSLYESAEKPSLTKIETGPYRGLFTTKEKNEYLIELETSLRPFLNSSGSILFYPHFPAGYLYSKMKPATGTLWMTCCEEALSACEDYYQKRSNENSLTVRVNQFPLLGARTTFIPKSVPFDRVVEKTQRIVKTSEAFTFYRPK